MISFLWISILSIRRLISFSALLALLLGNPVSSWVNPVSYTHLDVYKRQIANLTTVDSLTSTASPNFEAVINAALS